MVVGEEGTVLAKSLLWPRASNAISLQLRIIRLPLVYLGASFYLLLSPPFLRILIL